MSVLGPGTARRGGGAPSSLGGSTRLFLRRLRLEPGPPLTILGLVGATCFLFAALPRLFNDFSDQGLRHMVDRAPALSRNVRLLETTRLPAAGEGDPLSAIAARAVSSQQALPHSLQSLISGRTFVVRSPQYVFQPGGHSVAPVSGLERYLTIRVHDGVAPHIRLVAGRLPTASDRRVRESVTYPVRPETEIVPVARPRRVPLLQIALSTATARLLQLRVGDRAVFTPDLDEVSVQRVATAEWQPLIVQVAGLFTLKDPQASFWFGDATLGEPEVQQTPDLSLELVFGQALVSPEQYATVLAATKPLPFAYEYRYFLDSGRFDAGRLGGVGHAVARLDSRYAGAGPLERRVEVGLGSVLERYGAARSQAETLLALAAIGLLACALANVGLLGALSYERRRTETTVARSRGASPSQVLAAQAAEVMLVAAPAGFAGWLLARQAIDARGSSLSAWLALAIVAATVVLLVGAIAGIARRPLGPFGRDDAILGRLSPRRLALEGLVVAAAGLGVYLLRRRGFDTASADSGFDPYLAGVPVLLGVACGIVALRLYPLPVAGAARLARRARGLALHLGLSRAARQPEISSAPLLVLILALAVASFSSAMLKTLEGGQNETAWRTVGADVRVDAPGDASLPASVVSRLDSAGEVASAYVQDAGVGDVGQQTLFVALDLTAYERVVAGTPAEVRMPRALRMPAPFPGAVPALVSSDWPAGGYAQITLARETISIVGVAERASFPGIPRGTPFAVVPLGALRGITTEPVEVNRLYVGGSSAAAAREVVQEARGRAEIASRAAVVQSLRASPLVENVLRAFRAAVVLAALYAAVAIGLMALIAARSRSRDLALVRTMGASQRESLVLAAVELTPFVATALLVGTGLGLAIPHLIAPGLDLALFTGSGPSPIETPWISPAVFAAGVALFVAAAVLLVGFRARRAGLSRVLRIGER